VECGNVGRLFFDFGSGCLRNIIGNQVPKEMTFPNPTVRVADNVDQATFDLEIKPEKFTPPDQIRRWIREWPADLKINPAALLGQQPPPK
jgi:hypothetical protein